MVVRRMPSRMSLIISFSHGTAHRRLTAAGAPPLAPCQTFLLLVIVPLPVDGGALATAPHGGLFGRARAKGPKVVEASAHLRRPQVL